MAKSATIFLLQFFDNLFKNLESFEVKKKGKRIKKSYRYFPGISKEFSKEALSLGYHLSSPPQSNHFCNIMKCINS